MIRICKLVSFILNSENHALWFRLSVQNYAIVLIIVNWFKSLLMIKLSGLNCLFLALSNHDAWRYIIDHHFFRLPMVALYLSEFIHLLFYLTMAQLAGADEIESFRLELAEIGRSIRSSFRSHAYAEGDNDEGFVGDEEHDLHWAAVERLPTFERITTALFDDYDGESAKGDVKGRRVVDVTTLGGQERRVFIEKLIKHIENDNLQLLQKIKQRIDK